MKKVIAGMVVMMLMAGCQAPTKIKEDIEALKSEITETKGKITELEGKITQLEGKITQMEAKKEVKVPSAPKEGGGLPPVRKK